MKRDVQKEARKWKVGPVTLILPHDGNGDAHINCKDVTPRKAPQPGPVVILHQTGLNQRIIDQAISLTWGMCARATKGLLQLSTYRAVNDHEDGIELIESFVENLSQVLALAATPVASPDPVEAVPVTSTSISGSLRDERPRNRRFRNHPRP